MEMSEIDLYTEAVACLKYSLQEGQKMSNVDIQLMLSNIQRGHGIVGQLIAREQDPTYLDPLHNLEQALRCHTETLLEKIRQLDCCNGWKPDETMPAHTASVEEKVSNQPFPDIGSTEQCPPDSQKQSRRSAIQDTIIRKGHLSFSDVAGLSDAKQALKEAIVMPLLFPHLFTGGRKPWKRILLYGPPGTGKSRLAQAIASEINSTFYSVSSADLVSSWVGESEKLIKELFQHATNQSGRSVIFIDEIDSICRKRSAREEEYTRRIKTELLKQMEGADNLDAQDKIFLLCATNCPWELDSAFLRRYQKRIYIPLPDKEARLQLLKIHTQGNHLTLTDEEWQILAQKTDGYSGSDMSSLVMEALYQPLKDLQMANYWTTTSDGRYTPCDPAASIMRAKITDLPPNQIQPRDIILADFEKSVQSHRRTVTEEELDRFKEFTEHFGESG